MTKTQENQKEEKQPKDVFVTGANQDEAVKQAQALAKKEGYERASLQEIVEIKYKARLF